MSRPRETRRYIRKSEYTDNQKKRLANRTRETSVRNASLTPLRADRWRAAPSSPAQFLEPVGVALERPNFVEAVGKARQEVLVEGAFSGSQGVVNPLTALASFNEFRFAKIAEMSGCRWLWNPQDGNNVANTQFTRLKQMKNPQARLIRERAELCICTIFWPARHRVQQLQNV